MAVSFLSVIVPRIDIRFTERQKKKKKSNNGKLIGILGRELGFKS